MCIRDSVRVKLSPEWSGDLPNVVTIADEDYVMADFPILDGWEYYEGWYYYTSPVAAGESTAHLIDVYKRQEPGSLYLCKDAEPVEGCGYQWDVTLSIEGINLVETSDTVLVIDCSNSMQDNSKIVRAKEAAKAFVNNLLTEESQGQTRIAVVTFASFAQVESAFCDYSGKGDLLTAIDQIHANWGDYGGTHIQAGIRRARNLLGSSSANHKNIVFLGDGAATYSYNLRSFSPAYFDYWYSEEGFNYYYRYYRSNSTIPENKFNYGSTIGNGTSNYHYYRCV